jgi:hypothetical protein
LRLAKRLGAISNELMAKAVEIDTKRDKNQQGAGEPGQAPAS